MGTKEEVLKRIESAASAQEIEQIFSEFLGPKGRVTIAFKSMKDLFEEERKDRGKQLNEFKIWLERVLEEKQRHFELSARYDEEFIKKEWIDISLPAKKVSRGRLHPLTQLRNQVEGIFARMGFSVAEGPEVEDEWHNFDALNIPENHPARDLWDTFWLLRSQNFQSSNSKSKISKSQSLLLRTHTSPVQIRYMETHNPPFRIIAPGRVFRHEATDASHGFQLHQVEGLMVGEDVSVANFKAIITEFYRQLFRKEVSIRLRPSFFPFVEPGFEVDMSCVICNQKGFILSERGESKGCSTCSHTGWLEMMGAGMVHPNVFKNVGYNPTQVQGFAFGMGLDRLAMMRYKIPDIRLLFSMDARFLEQF